MLSVSVTVWHESSPEVTRNSLTNCAEPCSPHSSASLRRPAELEQIDKLDFDVHVEKPPKLQPRWTPSECSG
jgi:hypothetical protein